MKSLAWDISVGTFNPGNFISIPELRDVPLDVILVRFSICRGIFNIIHVDSEGLVDKYCHVYNNKLKGFIDTIDTKFDTREIGYHEGTTFNTIATNITSEEFERFIEENKSEIESYIQSIEKLSWDIGIVLDGPYTIDQLEEINISYGTIICAIWRQGLDLISYGCVKHDKDSENITGIYGCVVPFKGEKPESTIVPSPGILNVKPFSGFYIVGQANSQAEFDDFIKFNNGMIRKGLLKYIKPEKDPLLSWDIPDLELKVGSKVRIKNKSIYAPLNVWMKYDSDFPNAYREDSNHIFYIVGKGTLRGDDYWVVNLYPTCNREDFFTTEDLELAEDTLSWDIPRLENDFQIGDRIRIKEGTPRLARTYTSIGELPIGAKGTVVSVGLNEMITPHIGVSWDLYPASRHEEIGWGFAVDNVELI